MGYKPVVILSVDEVVDLTALIVGREVEEIAHAIGFLADVVISLCELFEMSSGEGNRLRSREAKDLSIEEMRNFGAHSV